MIPRDTLHIVGSLQRPFVFDADGDVAIRGLFANELTALLLRLGTDQRMGSDEMRDWMNLLHLRLSEAIEL